jgi:hypothetical protein
VGNGVGKSSGLTARPMTGSVPPRCTCEIIRRCGRQGARSRSPRFVGARLSVKNIIQDLRRRETIYRKVPKMFQECSANAHAPCVPLMALFISCTA